MPPTQLPHSSVKASPLGSPAQSAHDVLSPLGTPHSSAHDELSPLGTPHSSAHDVLSPSQTLHSSNEALPPHSPEQSISTIQLPAQSKFSGAYSQEPLSEVADES